jgi:nicotinate-nucleotide adenylyltransferase
MGVFGGTFDPPHVGHLVAAIEARQALELDVVLMVVANAPWQKVDAREVSPAKDRLAMVAAAIDGVPGLEVSDVEVRRGGLTYTADTLAALEQRHPGVDLHLILGADAANGFTTWERYDEVADRARLVVVDRPGHRPQLDERFAWTRLDIPDLEISSTDLRERLRSGRSVRFLMPDGAAAYARERGLYR